jgi:hypothetical protein
MILDADGATAYRVQEARILGPCGVVAGLFRRAEDVIEYLRGARNVPHLLAAVTRGEPVTPDAAAGPVVYCGPVLYDFFTDQVVSESPSPRSRELSVGSRAGGRPALARLYRGSLNPRPG